MKEQASPEPTKRIPPMCAHGRLIDRVATADGQSTEKVRCLECGAVFDDPCGEGK
jgi:hypothetical protein